jgi:hypothetical protein
MRIQFAFIAEPSPEECPDTFYIAVKIPIDSLRITPSMMIKTKNGDAHHSALACEVLTICGKSITTGSPDERRMRMLNSLKSPWIRPDRANRTIRSIKVE